MWWHYHCYRAVGTTALLNDPHNTIRGLQHGQTVLVMAMDHDDTRQPYGVVDPLNPEKDAQRNAYGSTARHTVLEGYERINFRWVRDSQLTFLEAP